jgi:hypothetical protein
MVARVQMLFATSPNYNPSIHIATLSVKQKLQYASVFFSFFTDIASSFHKMINFIAAVMKKIYVVKIYRYHHD